MRKIGKLINFWDEILKSYWGYNLNIILYVK